MTTLESYDDSSTRLQILINKLNISGLQFAKAIGVSQSFVSIMASGKTKISRSAIDKIGKAFPRVNIHWLLTGEGEMFLSVQPGKKLEMVNEPDFGYEKYKISVPVIIYTDDFPLRKTLGSNLKTLAGCWGMKKNEMFGILMPGVQKQSVTNYLNGGSAPPLWVLIYLERVTGIGLSEWLTRDIPPSEMPSAPLIADAQVGEDQLSTVRKGLRDLLNKLGG